MECNDNETQPEGAHPTIETWNKRPLSHESHTLKALLLTRSKICEIFRCSRLELCTEFAGKF